VTIGPGDLPGALAPLAGRIEAYWRAKTGSRSQPALDALIEEMQLVLDRAGPEALSQLLRQATQAGWPSLCGETWLGRNREAELIARHPAYQEFRAH
jgi:hypothetical protein